MLCKPSTVAPLYIIHQWVYPRSLIYSICSPQELINCFSLVNLSFVSVITGAPATEPRMVKVFCLFFFPLSNTVLPIHVINMLIWPSLSFSSFTQQTGSDQRLHCRPSALRLRGMKQEARTWLPWAPCRNCTLQSTLYHGWLPSQLRTFQRWGGL